MYIYLVTRMYGYIWIPLDPACTVRDISRGTDLFLPEIKTLITLKVVFSFCGVVTAETLDELAAVCKGRYLSYCTWP